MQGGVTDLLLLSSSCFISRFVHFKLKFGIIPFINPLAAH